MLLDVPFDQGFADENAVGFLRIDRPEGHRPVGDDLQAEERHPLGADDLAAGPVPARVGVADLAEVAAQLLQPLGLDTGRHPGEQPRGADHLGGHDPMRAAVEQGRSGEDHGLPALGRGVDILFLEHGDVAQVAGGNRLMDGFVKRLGNLRPMDST